MDGHRYAEEEPSWYSSRGRHDPDVSGSHAIGNPYDSGIHERPSGAFRLPQQRPDPYALPGPAAPTTGGHARPGDYDYGPGRTPSRGPEYPTVQPGAEPPAREQEPVVRQPNGVYRSSRPFSSVMVAVVTGILMVPVVRLLIIATFAVAPTARTVVPAVLLTLGMSLTGIGLFAVSRGGQLTRDAWLRAPVAYLPAGLILLLAAGLAVA